MNPTLAEVAEKYKTAYRDILNLLFQNAQDAGKDGKPLEAYLYAIPKPNGVNGHIEQPTRFYLTAQMIQMLLLQIDTFSGYGLQIIAFHPLARNHDEYDQAFIQLEEQKYYTETPKPSFYIAPRLDPRLYHSFPEWHYDSDIFIKTLGDITPDAIYIRNDSATMASIKQNESGSGLENLSADQVQIIKDAIDILGFDKIKNITQILNPGWEYRSDDVHTLVEMISAVLVKGEGKRNHSSRIRMINYLNKNYPDINPEPYSPDNRLNDRTEMLCTIANPNISSSRGKRAKKQKDTKNSTPTLQNP